VISDSIVNGCRPTSVENGDAVSPAGIPLVVVLDRLNNTRKRANTAVETAQPRDQDGPPTIPRFIATLNVTLVVIADVKLAHSSSGVLSATISSVTNGGGTPRESDPGCALAPINFNRLTIPEPPLNVFL
jgi:hypothetical protein